MQSAQYDKLPFLTITLHGAAQSGKTHTCKALWDHFKKNGRTPYIFVSEDCGRRRRPKPPTIQSLIDRGYSVLIIEKQ